MVGESGSVWDDESVGEWCLGEMRGRARGAGMGTHWVQEKMGLALTEEVEIEESMQEGNQPSQGTPDGEGKEGCGGKDEVERWSSLGGMRETEAPLTIGG